MVARAGEAIVFPQNVSQGYRTRATMKALPTAPHHPRPYGLPALLPAFPTEVDAYWLTARVNPTIHDPARYTPDAADRAVYSWVEPCGQPKYFKLITAQRRLHHLLEGFHHVIQPD